MATLQRLLSQARRHSPISNYHYSSSSPWLPLHRSFYSSPNPDPNPTPNEPISTRPQSVPVQPVSYPIKPKDPAQPDSNTHNPQFHGNTGWSREDVCFVKDFNPSSPVSYPNRVAPLPEDKKGDGGESERTSEEMEAKSRKIEADNRVMRRVFWVGVEEQSVPFPTMVKAEERKSNNNKGQKVVHVIII
ncbi:uncharacterized protein LOC143625931 [Bidens hawaiensis]|uniref:uncharacterized protein LOC143625931 n=1 Tax=Bidens hawaiensis TaxID=980011 RepID=UPI00404B1A35